MGQLSHITGIEVDYNNLNNDRFSSNTIEAIKYRRAYARANNAIEGVVLSETDRRFMDSIPVGMSKPTLPKLYSITYAQNATKLNNIQNEFIKL